MRGAYMTCKRNDNIPTTMHTFSEQRSNENAEIIATLYVSH